MRIGIRTGSLGAGLMDGLALAAELGFDTLEAEIGAQYADLPFWDETGRQNIREAIRDTGCALDSVCAGAFWTISPASNDPAVRHEAGQLLESIVRCVSDLGVRWILAPITPGGSDDDPETSVARWIDAMRRITPIAEDHNITVCIENVGRGCGRSAAEMIRILDAVASPAVRAYYDIGNAVAFGFDPVAEIGQLGDRIAIVHVKDHADRLGAGDVPIPACLAALNAMEYPGILVFETRATADPEAAASFNLGYVRGVLDTLV